MKMDDIAWAMINEGENYEGAFRCGHREGYNEGVTFGEKRGANIGRKEEQILIAKNLLKELVDIDTELDIPSLEEIDNADDKDLGNFDFKL